LIPDKGKEKRKDLATSTLSERKNKVKRCQPSVGEATEKSGELQSNLLERKKKKYTHSDSL